MEHTTRRQYDMFIHGEWHQSSGDRIEVVNPSTGKVLTTVADGTPSDLDDAMASARQGLAVWRATHPRTRAQVLNRIAATLIERAQEFAELHALNSGASIATGLWTMNDVAARRFEYYAGLADKILGQSFVTPGEFLSYTLREPIGVTGHIIPWNGPLWIGTRSIAPALAAGNSVVVKPSSEAPLTLLEFAKLAVECGLPPGVLNVVTGRGRTMGDLFTGHPDLDAIYFTGSTETGRSIAATAATNNLRTVMELGGKSPNVVLEDADVDAALNGALFGIFANSGQICSAGSRLLVQSSIHDEFVSKLAEMAKSIPVGGPETDAVMGPLISARQKALVLDYITGAKEYASIVTGGGTPAGLERGFYVEPTIFDEVPVDGKIAREEIFGPVLAVTPFADVDEAVAIANDTDYGLAAGLWTQDVTKAHQIAQRVEAAQVFVNHYFPAGFELGRTPYKGSGYGMSEGSDAIYEYLNLKSVSVKIGESSW